MRHKLVVAATLFALAAGLLPSFAADPAEKPSPDKRITLNLPDAPLSTFLKIITEASGLKILTSGDIGKRPISIYLPEVTAKEALDSVCRAFDLYYEQDPASGVVIIKDSETAFFPLEHTTAKEVQKLVPALLGKDGRSAFDEKYNFVSVQGSRSDIAAVRQMVARIDETPRQVNIEAMLAELDETAEQQLGIRWEPGMFFRGATRMTKLPFRASWVTSAEDAGSWAYGFISAQDFYVQLQFMERDGNAKILATPRTTVLDRREAVIQIAAHTVVATKLTRQTGTLELVTEEPVYEDVGVTLKTTPRIHPDNKITLEVEPSVTTAQRSRFFEQSVDTFVRSAKSTVMAEDGETIAIGGLLRDDTTETIRKLPFLGDVPLLKYLFTHKDYTSQKTDLVVLLTPRLVKPGGGAAEAKRVKELMGIGKPVAAAK